MGRFQQAVERERAAARERLERHYRVVPPTERSARLEAETVDYLLDHLGGMLATEFSRVWNGREGAGP
jgi:hypothetical protein